MNIKTKRIIGISLIINIIVISLSAVFVLSQSSTTFTISEGVYPSSFTYTVYKEGTTYYAKNDYGRITNSGTNFSLIMNNIITDNTSVLIKANKYYCDAPIDASGHGVRIEGEGKFSTMIYATNDLGETIYDKPSGIFYVSFATGTTLSKGVKIANLGCDGQGYHMTHLIWYEKVEESIIDNVYVTNANTSNCGGWVDLGSASYRCVISNSVARQGTNGFANEGFFHNHASKSIITGCVTYGGYDANTPAIKGGEFGGSITNNQIHNCELGILAESENHAVIVANNYIYNSGKKAIQVKAGKSNAIIEGNVIFKCGDTAIDIRGDNVIISNNWIYNSTNVGILLEDTNNCIVSNNYVNITTNSGIQIKGDYTTVTGNNVHNAGVDGIQLKSVSTYNTLTGNICFDNTDDGIDEQGSSDYNLFVGNICKNNGDQQIAKVGANTIQEHNHD